MANWQNLNTKKKLISKTVPLSEKDALRAEVKAMEDAGLCIINNETTTSKSYKINYVITKEELTADAIRALFANTVKPVQFKRTDKKKKQATKEKRIFCDEQAMAIVNIADFHFNRQVSGEDGYGVDYDADIAEKVFVDAIQDIKRRLRRCSYNVERIVLNTCGDFLNSDNKLSTTTNGTPQRDNVSYKQALIRGCRLIEYALTELSAVAPVEYYYVAGNHDEHLGLGITLYQEARFRDYKDITINAGTNSRALVTYGTNVIVLAHGDTEGTKAIDLPYIEPKAKELVSTATNLEVLTGHLHSTTVRNKNGVRWEILNSACPVQDNWSYDKAYGDDHAEATIMYYNSKGRVQQDTIDMKQFLD